MKSLVQSVRSNTFSKDRQLSRKQNCERFTLLCYSKAALQHNRKLLFLPSLIDARIPARNKQSCPSWREKNIGLQSCIVIREALHRLRRLFKIQLQDLVPEYKKIAKIHCQCVCLFYLQLSLHKATM